MVFAAAYAVAVSKCPASMLKMRVHGLTARGVTFDHSSPPFVVTWICPSSVPAQRTFTSRDEGESAVMVPAGAGFTSAAYLPALAGTSHVWRARSPLIRVQLLPPSSVFHTALDA